MSDHAMIDIESTDTHQTAGVLTIGAVKFDPTTGKLGDKFYARIGYDHAVMFGTVSASTIAWWDKQDPAVREEAFNGNECPYNTATKLAQFCRGAAGVWGNGATFDIGILDHWYHMLGMKSPWMFNVRDCRTVEALAEAVRVYRKSWVRKGDHHNALDDAIYQAEYISGMWQTLVSYPIPEAKLPEPLTAAERQMFGEHATAMERDRIIQALHASGVRVL